MLLRLHHVVADGTAALALFGSMLDLARDAPSPVAPSWRPAPAPSAWELLTDNLPRQRAALRAAGSRLGHPVQAARRLRSNAVQLWRLLRAGHAPRSSLNRPVGEHRRLLLVRGDLERARQVAHAHGAKLNDVVLAAIAGGARDLLDSRGELTPELRLRIMVPVNMRAHGDPGASGNLVGAMIVPLPVGEPDTVRRLVEIARTTAERKRRPPLQPAGRCAQRGVVRVMAHQRLVNLFTSNLTGPATPAYLAGARILEVFQIGVIQGNVTLAVGVLSYAGRLGFDIIADADAYPDLAVFATGLCRALQDLGVADETVDEASTDRGASMPRCTTPTTIARKA